MRLHPLPALGLVLFACRTAPAPPEAPAAPPAPSVAAPATASPAPEPFRMTADGVPADELEELRPVLRDGIARVEAFFGAPFPEPFEVLVLADRASFTASFPPEWGMPETACWMVASGVADALRLLAPSTWRTEACEHDPSDARHVADLVAHELVHVYHGQHNPTRDFVGAEEVGWLAEGLAVLVSGQLETGHRASAAEAVATGRVPTRLQDAWSGPHRYGVAGTLAEHLDRELGRDALRELLGVTTEAELLAIAGRDERELLDGWRESVLAMGTDRDEPPVPQARR